LQECEPCSTQIEMKRNIVRAIERVAARLGNTPAVCRKAYVHPAILELYANGALSQALTQDLANGLQREIDRLQPEEAAVLRLLQQRLKENTTAERPACSKRSPND
jgi:DNA topoisomerase I